MVNQELVGHLDSRFKEIGAGKKELAKRIAMHAINSYAIENRDAFMGSMTEEGDNPINDATAEELTRRVMDVAGQALNEWFGVEVTGGSNWKSDSVVEFFLGESPYSLKKSLIGRDFDDNTASTIASDISENFGQVAMNPIATGLQDIPTKNAALDSLDSILSGRGLKLQNKDDIDQRTALRMWALHNSGDLYSDRVLPQFAQYVKKSYN